jgi:hypothetical protein
MEAGRSAKKGIIMKDLLFSSPKYLQDWGRLQGTGGDSRGIETAR